MLKARHKDPDDLLEVLRAYRLPTIIMSFGLILAIVGFQMALRYDIAQSERSFREISEQVYRTLDTEIRRHVQLVSSMSRILGQIRDLTEEEFSDVANIFSDTTYFKHFYLYSFNAGDGLIKLGKDSISAEGGTVLEHFSSATTEETIDNIEGLPVIRKAVEQAYALNNTYFSHTYSVNQDGIPHLFSAVASPLSGKHSQNLYLVGILNLDPLFASTLKTENQTINVRIHDVSDGIKSLVYEQIEPQSKDFFAALDERQQNILSFHRTRFFDDHVWDIGMYSSMQSLIDYVGLFPWITFIFALLITGLLGFIVFRITTENVNAMNLVEKQTKNLRQYAEKLEMSNRDLDDFAHIASHDLKEPLRGIYNYSEFLIEDYHDKLDEEGRKKLNTLKTLARRMESLVESLLEYSKLSRIDLAFKKSDLNEIVQSAIETLSIWLDEQNARVKIIGPLPEVVCDPVKVTEIFRNLITNAVKYNDQKTKIIEIGYRENYAGWGDIPVFYVKDNGIGIDEKHKEQVFKIFRRLHGREEYGGGTGAGLTIIWKIVERHGGKIWFASEPNEGTTFFFTLKRKLSDAE